MYIGLHILLLREAMKFPETMLRSVRLHLNLKCHKLHTADPSFDIHSARLCITHYETERSVFMFVACDCSTNGATLDSLYNCDNFTGQCECKTNVMGRRCDECLDTFWNLTRENPDGCIGVYYV